jgi:hypothetical protein
MDNFTKEELEEALRAYRFNDQQVREGTAKIETRYFPAYAARAQD